MHTKKQVFYVPVFFVKDPKFRKNLFIVYSAFFYAIVFQLFPYAIDCTFGKFYSVGEIH